MTKVSRIEWIEALRAIALLMVVIPHFIVMFCPNAFCAWDNYSWALKGISGKHGVAIFCVLIGYFSSRKSERSIPTYVVQRYLLFFVNIFVVLFFFWLVSYKKFEGGGNGILSVIKETLLFRAEMVPTYWCVRALFGGSLICFVLGNYCNIGDKRFGMAFMMIVCFYMKFVNVWLSICVMGATLRFFSGNKHSEKSENCNLCCFGRCHTSVISASGINMDLFYARLFMLPSSLFVFLY